MEMKSEKAAYVAYLLLIFWQAFSSVGFYLELA